MIFLVGLGSIKIHRHHVLADDRSVIRLETWSTGSFPFHPFANRRARRSGTKKRQRRSANRFALDVSLTVNGRHREPL